VKPSGWVLVILSWGLILLLFIFSLARTLTGRKSKKDGSASAPR
jgi:hypothetical protein